MTSSRHYRLKKIRSTFSENRNGIFTSDIEIRMPTTEIDDKRIQIFIYDCSKGRDCKLDILSFAMRINKVLKNPPNMPILAFKYSSVAMY